MSIGWMAEAGIYLCDGVPTYAREDRGPYRLLSIETDGRVAEAAHRENARWKSEDRQRVIVERVEVR